MYNPFNDIQGKWEISNMDDAHYYRMGSWIDKPQVGVLGRGLTIVTKLFGWLGWIVSSLGHLFNERSKTY
jgi:hypothetical protein